MSIVIIFCSFFLGCFVGALFLRKTKTLGTLFIDFSDPMKDIYQIKINDLNDLNGKKYIGLDIREKNNSYNGDIPERRF